jgi:hypothetical protein
MDSKKPKARIFPYLIFFPVNPRMLRKLVKPFLTGGLIATAAGGVGAFLSRIWEKVPGLMQYLDIQDSLLAAQTTFLHSVLFAILALTLLGGIITQLMDFQLVYSVSRTFLFLAFYYVICAIISLFPKSLFIHIVLAALVLIIGTIRFFFYGSLGYYWMRRSYGDAFLEFIIMLTLVYFAWSPIYGLMRMGSTS